MTEKARTNGWLAALASAYRVQARLPFIVARRIGLAIVATLGDESGRYTAGLPNDFKAENDLARAEESLYRLIEGVLLDWPTLIAVDDIQWCDPESLALLERLIERFADRPLAFVSVERQNEPGWDGFGQSDEAIVLEAFSSSDAERLARSLIPNASDNVIARIAEVSAGRAIDIVAIAESVEAAGAGEIGSVASGIRAVVARDLAQLPLAQREFLQILALIEEPITPELLHRLWDEERLLPMLEASAERYLTTGTNGFLFRHSALAQAIRETIPIEIPYRRRIISAVTKQATLAIPDLEQIIAQIRACGDTTLELDYLERLAGAASAANEPLLLVRALERRIELTPFNANDSLPLYTQLSMAYNSLNREREAIRVCSSGLNLATLSHTQKTIGPLIGSYLMAAWLAEDRDTFDYLCLLSDSTRIEKHDKAQIISARMYAAMDAFDETMFLHLKTELLDCDGEFTLAQVRAAASEAFFAARKGNQSEAMAHFARARQITRTFPKMVQAIPDNMEMIAAFFQGREYELPVGFADAASQPFYFYLRAITAMKAVANGHFADAIECVVDSLVFDSGSYARNVLLGIAASAAVLGGVDLPKSLLDPLSAAAAQFMHSSPPPHSLLPLATAYAALQSRRDASLSRALVTKAAALWTSSTPPSGVFAIPALLARCATSLGDRDLLLRIAHGDLKADRFPWSLAHHQLATQFAALACGNSVPKAELDANAAAFTAIGAPFFATVHASHVMPKKEKGNGSRLSRREREIVELISAGRTNREIAITLSLSERTVEGHIANAFNRVGASSRSQLVAWYLRSLNPVA